MAPKKEGKKEKPGQPSLVDETQRYQDLKASIQHDLLRIRNETAHLRHQVFRPRPIPVKIEESAEAQRKRLENRAIEKDIELKEKTLNRLFDFLTYETYAIFIIAFLQGFGYLSLDPWNFRVLVTATIIQITVMLTIAVRHLFPDKSRNQ